MDYLLETEEAEQTTTGGRDSHGGREVSNDRDN